MLPNEDLYAGRLPEIYDLMYPDVFGDIASFVAFVEERAAGKRLLEFGVGTGRLALPLADAGFDVTGTDVSPGMLAALAVKDESSRVSVVESNFISDRVDGEFDVVLLMINTIFVARNLAEQISVFNNAAASLAPDGFFLVETFNPAHFHQLDSPEVQMRTLDDTTVLFEQYSVEPTSQLLFAQNVVLGRGELFTFTHLLHYMFPLEMDAAAKNAGLVITERFAHWSGIPYDSTSPRCLSVYRKSAI
ncbi:bifunctional 2-polyprenyl-6-hydroxyphenol methylase/3-demethylubiquinol 3-O-methyltransferase UbiG [Agreia sp. COWG]|uniref:class I SAM-dependent methyltransferase n=1 Tax=Agreia sp. COWG TaxID=2773266 RepID=UPI00192647FB|nr:class I SAM-dependent methyltransferase [Agreia sp. COWG]CAD5990920.1 Methyltransferase [Agreia sp. COWG]